MKKRDINEKRFITGSGLFIVIVILVILFGCIRQIHTEVKKDNKEKENEFSEIEYTVPKYFEEEKSYYNKEYSYNENSVYCYIYIDANKRNDYSIAPKDYLEKYVSFTSKDEVSDITEIDSEKVTGYQMSIKADGKTTYYYSIETAHYRYDINYRIYDYENGDREDATTNKCITSREKFINSLRTVYTDDK